MMIINVIKEVIINNMCNISGDFIKIHSMIIYKYLCLFEESVRDTKIRMHYFFYIISSLILR